MKPTAISTHLNDAENFDSEPDDNGQREVECVECGCTIATCDTVAARFVCDECACRGHEPDPACPNQPQGRTFYCDGSCRK